MSEDEVKLDGKEVKTVEGSEATVTVKDGAVSTNGAKVTKTDIATSNGVIRLIDAVILPQKGSRTISSSSS